MRHGTQVYQALAELVRLKGIKDKMDLATATQAEIEDYDANKATAWRNARTELQGAQLSPLARCKPGEPLFILRAQDRHAPGLVLQWANRARKHGTPEDKCAEAEGIGRAMETYEGRRDPT